MRGTVGDILARDRETIVTVVSGKILACSIMSYRCTVVLAGETAKITLNSATKKTVDGPKAFSFEGICGSGSIVVRGHALSYAVNEAAPDLTTYAVGAARSRTSWRRYTRDGAQRVHTSFIRRSCVLPVLRSPKSEICECL